MPEPSLLHNRYLHLDELAVEGVIWVDEVDALRKATCHFEECKVVGLDCEWKPNYVKGSRPNKVNHSTLFVILSIILAVLLIYLTAIARCLDNRVSLDKYESYAYRSACFLLLILHSTTCMFYNLSMGNLIWSVFLRRKLGFLSCLVLNVLSIPQV